jgi:hypothetical protein
VNLQRIASLIINEPQFPEPVHEEANPRASCTYHLCEGLLADCGDYRLGHTFFAKMSRQKQDSGQPFFAGIEELVN